MLVNRRILSPHPIPANRPFALLRGVWCTPDSTRHRAPSQQRRTSADIASREEIPAAHWGGTSAGSHSQPDNAEQRVQQVHNKSQNHKQSPPFENIVACAELNRLSGPDRKHYTTPLRIKNHAKAPEERCAKEKTARSPHPSRAYHSPIRTLIQEFTDTIRVRFERFNESGAERFFSPVGSRMRLQPLCLLCGCPVGSAASREVTGGSRIANRCPGLANTPIKRATAPIRMTIGRAPGAVTLNAPCTSDDLLAGRQSLHRNGAGRPVRQRNLLCYSYLQRCRSRSPSGRSRGLARRAHLSSSTSETSQQARKC